MAGNSEKGSHYISLLDTARVDASWNEFPELIRKVNKHAPQRKLLIHTATAEHEVATNSSTEAGRPPISTATKSTTLSTLPGVLQSDGDKLNEDSFQGKTCLLWSRWVGPERNTGTTGFDVVSAIKRFDGRSVSVWTKICMVKSAYIEGTSYMQNGRPTEAQKVYGVVLVTLQSSQDLVLATPQLAYWTEQLLAQQILGSTKQAQSESLDSVQTEAFKYWGIIASKTREVQASTFKNSTAHASRLTIWRKYYEYLSISLWKQTQTPTISNTTTRTQQAIEIRKVERAYENELLRVTKFPTASETNAKVEEWVEQAIRTWQVLCGPQWREAELGEGGRNAIGRNMLDVLYRAATKTFHSTLILRRLFQVHLSLGEFVLAYRAFDTYIELVDRGRTRVAKSKQAEPGHESDEAILSTISEAVVSLCKFGRQEEARKAYGLCTKLEDWLVSVGVEEDEISRTESAPNGHPNGHAANHNLSSNLLQVVYRAIGTGKAHWARWTPASEHRSGLQEEALESLRKASAQGGYDIETLYTTSLLLAESRDIPGAVRIAKVALAKNTSANTHSPGWATERKLVSQWHLLSLLLSSRQDFDSATKSCVGAFEQFASGDIQVGSGRNASVTSNIEKQFDATVSRFTDEMEFDELQKIVEVKITELALIELTEGPEEAVNNSNELLSLYSRLFAHIQVPLETSTTRRNVGPPKSSAGTVKSTRTSIFGRRKHDDQIESIREKPDDMISITTATDTVRPDTRATQAPTIQITSEDDQTSNKKHFRTSHESTHSKGSRRLSHRLGHRPKEDKPVQTTQQISSAAQPRSIQAMPSESVTPLSSHAEVSTPVLPVEHETSTDGTRALSHVSHNLASDTATHPSASHDQQLPQQDVRLPTHNPSNTVTSPPPRFSKSVAQKQALTVLAKVWLVIATLYRRAHMFEDSKEACEEAGKAAAKIEALVGATDQSVRAFSEAGWGAGTKSSDEVWADIYCEHAELELAIYTRKGKEDISTSDEELRTVLEHYEQCLMFVPNHPAGIIGLSNILLDSYERKVDLGRRVNGGRPQLIDQERKPSIVITSDNSTQNTNGTTPGPTSNAESATEPTTQSKADEDLKKTPENLNRIAARDRAYGLLSTLTKSGTGWDNSEAWFALARAHELGGEVEKAKSILWWCVELEDTKPIRHWRNLGYVL